MKVLISSVLVITSFMVSPTAFAQKTIEEKYREPDLRLSTYKIDDNYYASFSGTVNVNENISIDATLDSGGYLELGTAYGDVFFDTVYAEAYVSYGRTDTTDIYTLGMFAGLPLSEHLMVFANSAYDWRSTQDNILGVGNNGVFDEQEWKNTAGLSYSVHNRLTLASTYNVDYLADSANAVDSRLATSWDVTATFNVPWFSPYVKYSKGDYRVTPDQERKSQDNIELGLNFNF